MAERVRWIDKEGYRILSIDLSRLPEAVYLQTIGQAMKEILGQPVGVKIATVVDTTETLTTEAIRGAQKKMSDEVQERRKSQGTLPTAVLGITGIKRVIAKAFAGNFYFAKDLEDAVGWIDKELGQK